MCLRERRDADEGFSCASCVRCQPVRPSNPPDMLIRGLCVWDQTPPPNRHGPNVNALVETGVALQDPQPNEMHADMCM